jgi:glycosyltransferase involved in cell wall biosynthesis
MCEITAIITTHNRADLLPNAIKSVLNQTFIDFKLLIIDDASKDNTEEVVKKFADSRIQYIKIPPHETKGGNYARNLGIKLAKGEFIAFLDDDDEWMPKKLEKQLEVFQKDEQLGLVYTGLKEIYPGEGTENTITPLKRGRGDLSKNILVYCYIGPTSTIMVKKNHLEKTGLFDIKMPAHQDYDFYIRICQFCKIDFVQEPLTKYYRYPNISRISDNTEKYEMAYTIFNKKYQNLILSLDIKDRKQREVNIYETITRFAVVNGDFSKVKSNYLKALFIKFDLKIFTKLLFAVIGIYDLGKVKRKLLSFFAY